MRTTTEIMDQYNRAFLEHDPALLADLVAPDCVMESIQPAPDGTRYEGEAANLKFWQDLAADRDSWFDVEETFVTGDRATIRWRFNFAGGSVRGVNLMRVQNGRIVEALGYAKSPGQPAPLPE